MGDSIVVRDLKKIYEDVVAVDGISFTVAEGCVFAFLGPNGAGKTTTVEIMEGLRKASSGEVRVLGMDPWTEGPKLHLSIGVIPQDFRFLDKIKPKEAVEYYASLFGRKVSWREMLEKVDLMDKAGSRFDKLSGGQKQKLGLALSMVNDPPVLFLDEPTTGLDPTARRTIWNLIRSMKRAGRTVFLTTHYMEEAELLADRVGIIHHGHIIAEGTPEEIIRRHGGPERLSIDAPRELGNYLSKKLGVETEFENGHVLIPLKDKHDAVKIIEAADESRMPWTSLATVRDNLEDVFVSLIGEMDEGVIKVRK